MYFHHSLNVLIFIKLHILILHPYDLKILSCFGGFYKSNTKHVYSLQEIQSNILFEKNFICKHYIRVH